MSIFGEPVPVWFGSFTFSPHRARRPSLPDGLRTLREGAERIGCSVKTLKGHIASGALSYVPIGLGRKRLRRMLNDADIDAFIANQTRKDVPCLSTVTRARRSGTSISNGEVIDFTAPRRLQTGVKPKR